MPTALRASVAALLTVAALLAGCGSGTTPSPATSPGQSVGGSPGSSGTAPSAGPSAGASPADSPRSASPSSSIGRTETDWGSIWDTVPASFPTYPGAEPVEPDTPASLTYDVATPADAVATALQAQLEAAGFSTIALSGPLEDGSSVVDSAGGPPGCEVQTTIAPLGGTTRVTVLYGVGCPPG